MHISRFSASMATQWLSYPGRDWFTTGRLMQAPICYCEKKWFIRGFAIHVSGSKVYYQYTYLMLGSLRGTGGLKN